MEVVWGFSGVSSNGAGNFGVFGVCVSRGGKGKVREGGDKIG